MTIIQSTTLKFLHDIAKNNEREWFNQHKSSYLTAHQNLCDFLDRLIFNMSKHDELETLSGKESLLRIYSDVRFSKNKAPYKPRFAFSLSRATKLRRGGYYGVIKPGESFLACGFWAPNPTDLARIRQDIQMHERDWRKLLGSKKIKDNFGDLKGDKVPTIPRGFDKAQPGIDLVRHKQFFLRHDFSDSEVLAKNFLSVANNVFKSVRPFFDYMSVVLTTDANGQSLIEEA